MVQISPEATSNSLIQQTLNDIQAGLIFIWRQPLVRALTFLGFGLSFTGGAVVGLLVVYAVEGLGMSPDDPRIGLLFAAGAAGSLVAGLLLPQLTKHFPIGWITLASYFLNLIFLLGLVFARNFLMGLLFHFLWELVFMLAIINGISLRQIVTPDALQSRVNTTARLIAWGGQPFGAAIGGLMAEVWDIRTAWLMMSFGVAISLVIGWFSPLRERTFATEATQ
jgi:hypothetical protein